MLINGAGDTETKTPITGRTTRSDDSKPHAKKRERAEKTSLGEELSGTPRARKRVVEDKKDTNVNKPRAKKRIIKDKDDTVINKPRARKKTEAEVSGAKENTSPLFDEIAPLTTAADTKEDTATLFDDEETEEPAESDRKLSSSISDYLDKKLGDGFSAEVERVARNVGVNAKDLVAIMAAESGLNPDAGKGKSAVGLFQFTSSAAKQFDTDLNTISNMSAIEQLHFAEKTLSESKRLAGFDKDYELNLGDIYAANFLPASARSEVLAESGGKLSWAYNSNSGLDLNNDGKITKSELAKHAENMIRQRNDGFHELYFSC